MTRRHVRPSDHDPVTEAESRLGSRLGGRARWDDEREPRADHREDAYARGLPGARFGEDVAWDHDDRLGTSERRAVETASRTAETLSSVASWIERAQRQLDETAAATTRLEAAAQRDHRAAPDEAPFADALAAIRRIEDRLSAQAEAQAQAEARSPGREAAEVEKALRGFEARFGEIAERLGSTPKMTPRRPLKPGQPLRNAVDEILSHQTRLERDPLAPRQPSGLPALGTLARSQTAMLTTLKQEVAKLASRIEDIPVPRVRDEQVQREVETLRRSMAEVARRDDLSRLESGLQSLTSDIMELRRAGERSTPNPDIAALQAEIRRLSEHRGPDMSELQAEIRRLSERRGPDISELQAEIRRIGERREAPVDIGPIARDIQNLSHKLDRVADGGLDPAAIVSLSDQIEHVRQILAEAGAPQALGLVDRQLAAIREEIAEVGGRQVGPREFEALRATIEDVRGSLVGLAQASAPQLEVERMVREFGRPIEATLVELVDKIDRVERRVGDSAALDHLENQIQALAARMSDAPTRDPSLAGLERAMGDILQQVSSWRDGAVEAAEHAARTAVVETLDAMPVAAEVERHLVEIGDRYAAAEERTRQSLAVVHSSLSDVMVRLSSLETSPTHEPAPRASKPGPMPHPRPSAPAPEQREPPASFLAEADLPLAPPVEEDVLLEPGARPPVRQRGQGASRPSAAEVATERTAPASEAGLTPDIKSSFIAAARRAAQAAAAESQTNAKPRPAAQPRTGARISPTEMVDRVRRLIDSKRRPLLLAAAAIVLALGTMQAVRTHFVEKEPSAAVAIAPTRTEAPRVADVAPEPKPGEVTAATTPAPAPLPPPAVASPPEPVTTQSISPEPVAPTMAAGSPAKEPARVGETPSAAPPAAVPAKLSGLGDPSVLPPAGLKQAADRGNPIALYDLAARTADGRGFPRDPKAATALFEKAAEKGLAPAQYRVGNAFERGVGVTRDLERAKTWYRRAAEGGNVRAMHNLAVLLADGGGQKPDYQGAVGWFTKAAEHGVKDSQFNLAVLHARGLGTAQDLSRAYHWLALAALQGDEDAGRKRDEVGQRLPAAELARAKAAVERWQATPAAVVANEVLVPPNGFTEPPTTAGKRLSREARV